MHCKFCPILRIILILVLFNACSTKKQPYLSDDSLKWEFRSLPPEDGKVHTLYLIGDAGELDDEIKEANFVVEGMASIIDMTDKNSSVVFLGDNVYPIGLVDKKDTLERFKGERIINAQLSPLKSFQGKTYMIPGNHDWNKHKRGGLEAIKRQEEYVETHFGGKERIMFYPNMGCGDPEVVKINKEVVYIFLDSQWWLQNWKYEEEINFGCEIKSRGDLLQRMEELFLKYKNKEIICMLHHPIKSNGNHGGSFSLTQHVFPLAELGVWLPLPIIGSFYPIYRQVTGNVQDNTNSHNQNLTKGLESLATKHGVNVVFASGHEHGLEYYETDKLKYIVSGSGSKTSYIQGGGEATYARQARGFAKITFYKDFESWLEFYTLTGFNDTPRKEFRVRLRDPRAGSVEETIKFPPIVNSDTTYAANKDFSAGGFKKFFLGDQYRDIWNTSVDVEIIDLEKKYGGLVPIKKGGGETSNSLRMEHESGKQYILRSVKKDFKKAVPEEFESLKLLDIIKDQNSAMHPYGALAIPSLSKAAGIYYTEPKLVFLKHQRGLGNYNSQFPEELYLLEERPSGNWSDDARFGNSEEIIGYTDLLKKLRTKKHHIVDQKWVLKSRIFDLWIHDWDRHDDQWRWAKFKEGKQITYRPIPRDRDFAFYKFEGILPAVVSTFLLKHFKSMKHNVKDVKSLSLKAQYFDRYFLNELEWLEWQPIIAKLQSDLTDDVITDAMDKIPTEVQEFDNDEIISKLKSRRSHLPEFCKNLYDFLSKEVEVLGSDNNDIFIINHLDDGNINISIFVALKNDEKKLKYDRTFYHNETKELRLYGLRGNDRFEVNGTTKPKIKVRIIGGEDKDELVNETKYNNLYVYDSAEGVEISGLAKNKTSNNYLVNEYDRLGFKYNTGLPLLKIGNTQDDGWWFGGGYSWTNFGWRKQPFKSKNLVSFSFAPGSQNAFQINIKSDNTDVFGKLDLVPEIRVNFPRYENYFGLGNNSINPLREIPFNWVKLQTIDVKLIAHANMSKANYFSFGPIFQSQDIDLTEGRVSSDQILGFNEDNLDRRNYAGITLGNHMSYVDNEVYPSNGIRIDAALTHLQEISKDENITELNLGIKTYVRIISRPNVVLANALGYKKSWGDLQFHQYADLGNTSNLRGYRNNRFRGESLFYHNIDLRLQLFNWKNNWVPMEIGTLGGFDYGRVWLKDEISNQWHKSATVGIWMNIMDLAVIQPYYTFVNDDEGDVFTLLMGFNF